MKVNMSTDLTLIELSRRIGRSKSLVSRWAKQGKIPRKANGRFDEAAVRQALKRNLDPARAKPLARGEQSTPQPEVNMTEITMRTVRAANPPTLFEAGFIAALVRMTYDIGAISAVIAVDQGTSVEIGKALEDHMTVAFMERSEQIMRCLPMFKDYSEDEDLPGITYHIEHLSKVNWDVPMD
jgi:hypothetical protein